MNSASFSVDFLDEMESEAIITITKRLWFGFGGWRTKKYRGSCTVWRDASDGHRVSTMMELYLCDLWRVAKWRRQAALREGQ